jgi:hypothetical protein
LAIGRSTDEAEGAYFGWGLIFTPREGPLIPANRCDNSPVGVFVVDDGALRSTPQLDTFENPSLVQTQEIAPLHMARMLAYALIVDCPNEDGIEAMLFPLNKI